MPKFRGAAVWGRATPRLELAAPGTMKAAPEGAAFLICRKNKIHFFPVDEKKSIYIFSR